MVEKSDLRPLVVELFGSKRFIGEFPAPVMTDMLSMVEKSRRKALGRGKEIILAPIRMAAI
jgi:hypothetical protein